jgi:hypothetical protein
MSVWCVTRRALAAAAAGVVPARRLTDLLMPSIHRDSSL